MRYPEDIRLENFNVVVENEPAFLAVHPWVAYVRDRIEGFCSNYRLALSVCRDRSGYARWPTCLVHAPTNQVYVPAEDGMIEPATNGRLGDPR